MRWQTCQAQLVNQNREILINGAPVPVEVRRNARAKRLQFRLDARTGAVRLTLPPGVGEAEGMAFVQAKSAWIAARRPKIMAGASTLEIGASLPIDGRLLPLVAAARAGVDEDQVRVPADQPLGPILAKLLKARAQAILTPLAHAKAADLGLPIARLTYRDTKTRWGSCSAEAVISLNWRIICAEPLLQDYLVAHEVAHLKEPHHQPVFWDQCARLMAQPQALREAREKLRGIGPRLMALPLA